jgi:hypothetical protein
MDKKWSITFYTVAFIAIFVLGFIIIQDLTKSSETAKTEEIREREMEKADEETTDRDDPAHLSESLISLDEFKPETVSSGSNGVYELSYHLKDDDWIELDASIEVQNTSNDTWDEIAFYVVPNALPHMTVEFTMGKVFINGAETDYKLEDNQLFIPLEESLTPGNLAKIDISYEIKPTADGFRLRKDEASFYLAYSYPMLATYQNGWNIENFNPNGESYHTGYGEFTVRYELPKDYYVVSSAIDGKPVPHRSGEISGNQIKDFYIAFLDPEQWNVETITTESNVNLRAFIQQNSSHKTDEVLSYMLDSFTFFESEIGNYISGELDLITNNGGMEYPYVTEVYDPVNTTREELENVIAHEIGHQWFYHMISNDPYYEAWLDEGLTEFVVSIYIYNKYQDKSLATYRQNFFTRDHPFFPVNQSLEELTGLYATGAYGIPPFKLWEFYESEYSIEEATNFLSAYYDHYLLSQVTSEEFVRFFEVYYGKHYHEYFDEWLNLDWKGIHH